MLKVKIINRSGNALPTYATPQSAGMDLRANLEAPLELLPMQRRLIPTGLYIELPAGYEAQVRPRSGLALKHGITVLNSPGTIDADYRGELSVLLINLSDRPFTVEPGERIAQMVVARHEQVEWSPEEQLSETERGTGGYGHSGLLTVAGAMVLLTLFPTDASAAGRVSRRQQKAERTAAVTDSLAFEKARDEARRDYFYFAALQNRAAGGKAKSSVEMLRHAADIDSTSAPVAYSLAEYYERAGDKNNALAMSAKAAAIDTANLWYGLKEAELLMELNRPAEAITSYERLLRSHPDDVDICNQLGELYANQDSLRDCLRMLNRVEEIEGISPTLTMQKFYVYMHMGEPDSAFAVTQRLVDRHPYNATYRIIQGDILLTAGRADDALASYEAASRLEPDNANLWISKANYYTATGDEQRADSMIRTALTHPDLELGQKIKLLTEYLRNVLRSRGDSADDAEISDKEAAIDNLFASVSAMHPTAAEPYVLHAEYLTAIGRYAQAERCIRDAVDLQPANEDYWKEYLNIVLETEDSAQVRRVATEALQYHPSLLLAYISLAQVNIMENKYAEAQEVYRTAITNIPATNKTGISGLYGMIGDLHQARGMMDSAYISYDEALKYNAENINVLNNYSYFLALENRDLDRAERMISTVVRLKADEPTYLDTYAWVYFKQGNYMLAKFYQKRAIDASGDNVTATLLEHYGDILSCSGDDTGAQEYWRRALALPDNKSKTLEQKINTGVYVEEPFTPGEL